MSHSVSQIISWKNHFDNADLSLKIYQTEFRQQKFLPKLFLKTNKL